MNKEINATINRPKIIEQSTHDNRRHPSNIGSSGSRCSPPLSPGTSGILPKRP